MPTDSMVTGKPMTDNGPDMCAREQPASGREWILKRNCRLTPRQLGIAYLVLLVLPLATALMFMLHGIWFVFGFSILEMTGVALAFLHYGRHATDQEHIALFDECLLVERVQAGRISQVWLDPSRTRIALPKQPRDLIHLEARGLEVEIGRYVTQDRRRQVGQELRHALQGRSLALQNR